MALGIRGEFYMAKRLIIVLLFSLTVLLFSSISIHAIYVETEVRGDFFIKNVVINGERIENYNLQYSIVTLDDVMYIPLTGEMCEIYGIKAEMNWESRVLAIEKVDATRKNISQDWFKNDAKPLTLSVIHDSKIIVNSYDEYDLIYDRIEESKALKRKSEEVDLKGQPLLHADKHIYIPLRAIAESEAFNWNLFFNGYYGLCLSTDQGVPARNFLDEREMLENQGLVNYIMHINKTIPPSYGQQLVFLFKRAGEVYGVDPKLVMAMAHRESRFNNGSISKNGATGIMQIMPATGARYGLTQEQLLDPKTSIDFGTMYISERIAAYDGDLILALSAYNQGSTRVNRGTYSSVFANSVLTAYDGINRYLETNGYIL